jgi:hypothetical protein
VSIGIDVRVKGAEDLVQLARAAKAAGDAQIRKDLLRGIRDAVRPVGEAMRNEYRSGLPKAGGLADLIGAAKISPRTRTSGGSAGVRIVVTSAGHDMEAVEAGEIRHPVYGHSPWVSQSVEAGLGERGAEKVAPRARDDVRAAMEETARRIARAV